MNDLFSTAAAPADQSSGAEQTVQGRVTRVLFHGEDDGFYIFRLKPEGQSKEVTALGYSSGLAVGSEVKVTGTWEPNRNPRYKELQLKATVVADVMPTTLEGMRKLLHSGYIRGIGPKTADLLLETYGEKLFEVAEKHPELLHAVKGVGEFRTNSLVRTIRTKRSEPYIKSYLAQIGLGAALSHRVLRELGPNAVDMIKKDVYVLTRVPMIGFARADGIARGVGVPADSPKRIKASLEAALLKEAEAGSTAVPVVRLVEHMARLLNATPAAQVAAAQIEEVIAAEVAAGGNIVQRVIDGIPALSLKEHVRLERSVAHHLARLVGSFDGGLKNQIDPGSAHFSSLDDDQKQAAAMALAKGVSVITGRPGCGKTTVTKAVVGVLKEAGREVAMCAPTARAAKRMTEATGFAASTNHRLLESRGTNGFARNDANPLRCAQVTMDEVSMTDTFMLERTLRAIPNGSSLLLVGDIDQLKSVGAGDVLADIIGSGRIPVARLNHIHRQAEDSTIITNCHRIINGLEPVNSPEGQNNDFRIVPCTKPEHQVNAVLWQYQALLREGFLPEDIQVLTPRRSKNDLGADNLNRVIKEFINPAAGRPSITRGKFDREVTFSVGDRVMQTANNRDLGQSGIYNGDIGYVTGIDLLNKTVLVDFAGETVELHKEDLDDLDLAYACTIHKAQGSEFPAVIIPIARSHTIMLDRNLLYTAVSRGRKRVCLTGDTFMLKTVVQKASSAFRMTGLKSEIAAAFADLEQRLLARHAARKPAHLQFAQPTGPAGF